MKQKCVLLLKYKASGVNAVAFGDIFLEDLKKYREDNLAKIGMSGIFPIWKKDSKELAKGFIQSGFKAIITCVDTDKLDAGFAGRMFDGGFLTELPPGYRPVRREREFHSFAFDGPIFKTPVEFKIGETVLRTRDSITAICWNKECNSKAIIRLLPYLKAFSLDTSTLKG